MRSFLYMWSRLTVLAALALPLLAAPSAGAADALWATVNVCDTPKYPNEIGVRASMPGLSKRARTWMRFRVQYFSSADGKWHNFASDPRTDSDWVDLGRLRHGRVESGYRFTFRPPSSGGSHRLRGAVSMKWTRGKRERIVRREREITEAGHRSTKGADPPGYTAATCLIS